MEEFARKRILLIDDDDDQLFLTKMHLERINNKFDIELAKSAEEGLQLIEDNEFDCVVSDFEMKPGMNGVELLQTLTGSEVNIPFIMISNQDSLQLKWDALQQGADDFITKHPGQRFMNSVAFSVEKAIEKRRALNLQTTQLAAQLQYMEKLKNRYQTFFDKSPHISIFINADGRTIDEINEEAIKKFGKTNKSVKGMALTMLIAPEDRQLMRRLLLKTLSGEKAEERIEFVDSQGGRTVLDVTGRLIKKNDTIIGTMLCAK